MSRIYIRTYAFNGEKTLARTIESVLNQTHSDFLYYLCDNGSTDTTRSIVERYAAKDKRIRAFYNKYNRDHTDTEECYLLPYRIDENDFYCTLDADDEYKPEYFEKMLAFIEEFGLDIAVCGNDFLDVTQNNKIIGRRVLSRNMILQGYGFAELFPIYHAFMRTAWGKLYKGWTLKQTFQRGDEPGFPRAYGGDTFNTMLAFKSAQRVGILAESLHKYYISPKSVSYLYNKQRPENDSILHKAALDYLAPYGKISPQNEDYLFAVYLNALHDTCRIVLHAAISTEEKLEALYHIYSCEYTKQLAACEHMGIYLGQAKELQQSRKELFTALTEYLMSLCEVPDEQALGYCQMGEFYSAAAELPEEWLFFQKLMVRFFIEQKREAEAKERIAELAELLPDDPEVTAFQKQLRNNLN